MRTVIFCYPAARFCSITAAGGQDPRTASSHSPFGSTGQEFGQFQQAAVFVFGRPAAPGAAPRIRGRSGPAGPARACNPLAALHVRSVAERTGGLNDTSACPRAWQDSPTSAIGGGPASPRMSDVVGCVPVSVRQRTRRMARALPAPADGRAEPRLPRSGRAAPAWRRSGVRRTVVTAERLADRRAHYFMDQQIGLRGTILSIALGVAGLAAASLFEVRPADRPYQPLLWLLWLVSLLAVGTVYSGMTVNVYAYPSTVPDALDMFLPFGIGLAEFMLFAVLTALSDQLSPRLIVAVWFGCLCLFGCFSSVVVQRVRYLFRNTG